MRSAKRQHLAFAFTALLCLAFSGCGESGHGSNEPAETASASSDADSQPAAGDSAAVFADRAPETDMVPVRSDELNGIWLGTADNVAVVIRFIGSESRRPARSVIEGEWSVHVPGHTIGSGLEFIDDETTGVVELEVGLWNTETEKVWRASLGRVERGVSGRLYLSIYENEALSAAYSGISRISLKHISDHPKIQQEDVDQLLAATSHSP